MPTTRSTEKKPSRSTKKAAPAAKKTAAPAKKAASPARSAATAPRPQPMADSELSSADRSTAALLATALVKRLNSVHPVISAPDTRPRYDHMTGMYEAGGKWIRLVLGHTDEGTRYVLVNPAQNKLRVGWAGRPWLSVPLPLEVGAFEAHHYTPSQLEEISKIAMLAHKPD